jgi:DNA-binding MarR family transcriptional regulator
MIAAPTPTETIMAKLTDTQLVILSTAAKRDSRLLLPFSRTLKLNKGTLTSVLKGLIAKKLVEERPATKDEKEWRSDDAGRHTLVITDAGLAALGLSPDEETTPADQSPKPDATATITKPSTGANPKKGGKLDNVLTLVRRTGGASIADLQEATGWQPHSVRAALTGIRKRGVEITRSKNEDGMTVYTATPA